MCHAMPIGLGIVRAENLEHLSSYRAYGRGRSPPATTQLPLRRRRGVELDSAVHYVSVKY